MTQPFAADGAIHTTVIMSIRAIVFDFGNVVAFFSHRRAAEQPAKPDGLSAAEAQRWEDEFSDLLRDDPRLKEWFEMNESFEEE